MHHPILSSSEPFPSFSAAAPLATPTIASPLLSQALPSSPIISLSVAPSIFTATSVPEFSTSAPSLNAAASPFTSLIPPTIPVKPAKKSKKTDVPTTPTSFQNEQTKVELDIVRTKLKQTETKLKETNNMNNILTARNKLFEEQRVIDAHTNLFNTTQSQPTPSPQPPPPPTPPPPAPVSPPTPSQSPANQTIESLIQLELLKTIRASPTQQSTPSPPAPAAAQTCYCTTPPTSAQPPSPRNTGLSENQFAEILNMLQSTISQVSLLTSHVQIMESKLLVTPVQKFSVSTNTPSACTTSTSIETQTEPEEGSQTLPNHQEHKPTEDKCSTSRLL